MTTPAVSFYDESNRIAYLWYNRYGEWELIREDVINYLRSSRTRPQSQSSPRRADGTRAPLPWSHIQHRATSTIVDWYGVGSEWAWMKQNVSITAPKVETTSRPYNQKVYDRAFLDALTKLKDSKVNLGVMLAEARQTAELIGGTARRVAKAVDAWRHKRPGDLRKAVASGWRKVPSSYLEMSYGWTPLLGDVYNSAEALADAWYSSGRQPQFTVAGRAKDSDQWELPWHDTVVDQPYRGTIVESCQVTLCMELPLYLLAPLTQTGLTNPFEVIWEKVPYSFVADWILPVGNWLHTLDAGAYTHFREGSASRIYRITAKANATDRTPSRYHVVQISPGDLTAMRFNRSVISRLPVVPPLPSMKNPLKLGYMAKGMALLTQALSRLS